ncbi:MAG: glycosyltransferase family 4 protein [Desulfobacula sp.]|nr:glycosyltransferase family 4 protein [Desulfobacula sp.]
MKDPNCHKIESRSILFIEPLGDGGIAHYTYNLLNALSLKKDKFILLTNKNFEFKSKNTHFKVYNTMFRIAYILISFFPVFNKEVGIFSKVRRIIKILEYPFNIIEALLIAKLKNVGIIHCQSVNLIEILMVSAFKIFGIKVVYTIHNVMPVHQRLRFYHRIMFRVMYAFCDQIIIHTEKGKEEVIDLYSVEPSKINIIPHGDYKFFLPENKMTSSEAKKSLGISDQCRTILFFGAIRENKGLENIIKAMPLIIRQMPDVLLLIAGEPCGDYSKYSRIILDSNLTKNIWERLDYISNEDLPSFFLASDIVILPYHEVTGSGILQVAYAFSKPVVATDLDGFRETVSDGKNGYLTRPGDIDDLANKCIHIFSDNEKLEKMGKYSRELADTKYSWDSIAKRTMEVYGYVVRNS